jgi:Hydrazine synthase alpha subunit middle domain
VRTRFLLYAVIIVMACAALSRVAASSSSRSASTSILYTTAQKYEPLAWMHGGERFPMGAAIVVKDGDRTHPLASQFFATADPDVSFDGTAVLFAGKKSSGDAWQIWELTVSSGALRQVVSAPEDAVQPFYLPDETIAYALKVNGRFVIETAPLAGGDPQQITFAPGNSLPTDVLHDGRILFEASYPLGTGRTPEIYTVYPDGSGVEAYRCDHGAARYSGKQIDDEIVFTHGRGLAKFTSPLAHEVPISAPAGEYAGDIVETASGDWLVSWRANAKEPYELRQWKPGQAALEALAEQRGVNLIQPATLGNRTVPNRFPSALHDWKYANLMALNVYTSKYRIVKGSVKSVRVYERTDAGTSKLLGVAPVARDGSLYIRVPGDKPISFELLDRQGKIVKKQHAWMWARAGEQRICVGCHAGPERAPDNAVPAILEHSLEPADLTGAVRKSQKEGGN